jgi:hypothetical protein
VSVIGGKGVGTSGSGAFLFALRCMDAVRRGGQRS